jgi:hypothetical protein
MFRFDEILPALDGEHDVNIYLRVGVRHARKMPLLTELGNTFPVGSTNIPRLRRSNVSRFRQNNFPASFEIPPLFISESNDHFPMRSRNLSPAPQARNRYSPASMKKIIHRSGIVWEYGAPTELWNVAV